MFLDLETTSGNPKIKAVNPWHDTYVLGVALTVDDYSGSWYIPCQHHHGVNLPLDVVQRWVIDLFECCDIWINHNVKFDMQVMYESFGVDWQKPVYCTLTQAKLINSDRFAYSLDKLSAEWLKEDISEYENAMQPYLGKTNKDYAAIPSDIMGDYACQDVLTARRLYKYIIDRMPAESSLISNIENDTTRALVDIERNGLRVNKKQLQVGEFTALNDMLLLQDKMAAVVGRTFDPASNVDCFDVLCNQFGLPVMGYTDTGNPSFDKESLKAYLTQPNTPIDFIKDMLDYRKLAVLKNTFIRPYQELEVDGLLHSSYNQVVRTGRMSCKMPNSQQLSKAAKEFIICNDDEVMISIDYSQIEYRLIIHYIQDWSAIEAYRNDPFVDFHQWVADMCDIHRKPAKTVNFLMGYGGGRERLLAGLVQVPELVGSILDQVNELNISSEDKEKTFQMLARARASEVYTTYHDTLPGLKRTSRAATNEIFRKGYVRDLYGRHRHLSKEGAHRAFNSLCQGSAADLMKDRLVALWKWLAVNHPSVKLIACVHDEVLLRAPKECVSDHLLDCMCCILESVPIDLRVPIRTSCGVSSINWRLASDAAENRHFSRNALLDII